MEKNVVGRIWDKPEEMLCPAIHYRVVKQNKMGVSKAGIEITGCYGCDGQVVLPDDIDGLPVVGIAAYAFAQKEADETDQIWKNKSIEGLLGSEGAERICAEKVTEIWLPACVKEIGRYAFYRCRNLRRLTLTDSLLEIGGGAFTGCRLPEVEIHFYQGEKSCLKSIVDEIRFAVRADLYYYKKNASEEGAEKGVRKERAKVLFPEHYEEAVENTPARLLVTHHHGAGGYYRQCFYDRELDYRKYDELLYRTRAEEELPMAVELVRDRLCCPFRLEPEAKRQYEAFLSEHLAEAGALLVEQEDLEGLRYVESAGLWTEEVLSSVLDAARRQAKTECLSYLMEVRRRCFPRKRKQFEL